MDEPDFIDGGGLFLGKAVGTSFRQEALAEVCGDKTAEGKNKILTTVLVPESDNQYDEYAVRVEIDGRHVGYLPRQVNERFLRVAAGRSARCRGWVVGGWADSRTEGHFGVKLDLPAAVLWGDAGG